MEGEVERLKGEKVTARTSDSKSGSHLDDGAEGSFSEELELLELIEVARKLPLHAGDERSVEDVAVRND